MVNTVRDIFRLEIIYNVLKMVLVAHNVSVNSYVLFSKFYSFAFYNIRICYIFRQIKSTDAVEMDNQNKNC